MAATKTLRLRGTGGAEFTFDVPTAGTHEHERFLQRIENGDLIALDDDGDTIDRVALLAELTVADAPVHEVDALDAMSVKQLREFAAEHDIELGDAKTKAAIRDVLQAARDEDDDEA